MLKRTRGYILLTLLVLTGFAGQVSNKTINSTERRLLVSQLKDTKSALLQSLNDLSDKQLSFRTTKKSRSIGEVVTELETVQHYCLSTIETSLVQHDTQKKYLSFNELPLLATTDPGSADEIIARVKKAQAALIKYAKTTTEDLHGHILQTPSGDVDAYQALLQLPALTKKCISEIETLKQDPRFPK